MPYAASLTDRSSGKHQHRHQHRHHNTHPPHLPPFCDGASECVVRGRGNLTVHKTYTIMSQKRRHDGLKEAGSPGAWSIRSRKQWYTCPAQRGRAERSRASHAPRNRLHRYGEIAKDGRTIIDDFGLLRQALRIVAWKTKVLQYTIEARPKLGRSWREEVSSTVSSTETTDARAK